MAAASPSIGAYIGLVAFWLVAIFLSFVTAPLEDQPGLVWVIRVLFLIAGAGEVLAIRSHEKLLEGRGAALDRDNKAFDWWTIAHTTAGLIMGAWGVPFPMVIVFTIGWEIFEKYVPGFGDTEIFSNRVVDIAVAWVGWIIVAGMIALTSQTDMPWLLPSIQSLVRDAGLHLF